MENFDFEIEKIINEIKNKKAKIVGLQFPEGLKKYAIKVAEEVENNTNTKTIIFIDSVYGACDLKLKEAESLGIDLLIHFGHLKF